MRNMLLTLAFVLLSAAVLHADDPKAKRGITLKLGDPAPPMKVTKWLAGREVTSFDPGKIYVVEFWATWCGPCVVMMPHLGDLQEELGPKGVTIIGFTSKDPTNTLEAVTKFLDKRGDKLGYTIAFADNEETWNAYMVASGGGGIPRSFVIKDGKLAYIGHPLFLEEVLPKLLAGTWDPAKGTAELEAADKLWDATYATLSKPGEPEKQLAEWEAFNAKWPRLATDPYMNAARLRLLVTAKRFADARQLGEAMATKAVKRNDISSLGTVADALSDAPGQAELAAVAVKAGESALNIDGETAGTLTRLTKAYLAAGDGAKVKDYGPKAIAAAEKALSGNRDALGTLRVAAAYAAAGDKDKAKTTAEKAITLADPQMKEYITMQAKKYVAGATGEKNN